MIGVTLVVLVVAATPAKTSLFIKLPGNIVGTVVSEIFAGTTSGVATRIATTVIVAVA